MARVRDKRAADWFWMNKNVLDDYGAKIGPNGIAVYAFLARCANVEGHAFPSIRYIARHIGLSTNTVMKYLDLLQKTGLIECKLRRDKAGDMTNSEYILLTPLQDESAAGVSASETGVSASETGVSASETGVSASETQNSVEVSQPVRQVSQQLGDGVSTGETFQDPLNKKTQDITPDSPIGESPPIAKKLAKASKRCPADFVPKPETRQWAADKFPAVDFDEALEAMRDWEFKTPRSDWDAVLKNWIRTEAKRTPSQRSRASPSNVMSEKGIRSTQAAQRIIEETQRNGTPGPNSLFPGLEPHGGVFQRRTE